MIYLTTPIYYVNDEPHLGHAYTTILGDVLARFYRLRGEQVFFLTGVSEHGQKVFNAVRQHGLDDGQAYVDAMASRFRLAWERLEIDYDDFIRTTEARHVRVVQAVLQKLWEQGLIYRGAYEGWYCVPDERFWTEKDLRDGACPDCGRAVERLSETNYFFRLSAFHDWLLQTAQENPGLIQPPFRRNEVLGFLRSPGGRAELGDLCISRPRSRLDWGVPLPFDDGYVTYVWFDELLNYVTAAGYLDDPQRFAQVWPQAVHLIGKDILTPHSVYWPAMLHGLGLPLPRAIFAHGWWVVGGLKMGKSLGNAVRPLDLAEVYGVDAFRYFLMREMTPGQDADFDTDRLAGRYTTDLANNLGNLLQRVTSMVERYCGGVVPEPGPAGAAGSAGAEEDALRALAAGLPEQVFAQVEGFGVQAALGLALDALAAVNGYLERGAPWQAAKAGEQARVAAVLYHAGEALRLVSVLLSPVMPGKCAEIWQRLGWQPPQALQDGLAWGGWQPGSRVQVDTPLFPKMLIR